MKTLLILLAAVSLSYADQAADAFATGFANGLNQSLYGQQNTNNTQQTNVTYREIKAPTIKGPAHYDAVNNYGTPAGMTFATYSACRRYVARSHEFTDCVDVP
jgi:hypothetical protein